LLNQPVREVTVITPDPRVIAERDALKSAVTHLAEFIGFDDFRKIEAVVELFESDPAASKALANVFRVNFANVQSLMGKSSADVRALSSAYRDSIAQVALAVLAYRAKVNAQAKKEMNEMRLAVEASPTPPSDEEVAARKLIEAKVQSRGSCGQRTSGHRRRREQQAARPSSDIARSSRN
jgi:hypothetical protein